MALQEIGRRVYAQGCSAEMAEKIGEALNQAANGRFSITLPKIGEPPAQKWMNFYTRVLAKYPAAKGMKLTVKVEISPEGGVSKASLDETKRAYHPGRQCLVFEVAM